MKTTFKSLKCVQSYNKTVMDALGYMHDIWTHENMSRPTHAYISVCFHNYIVCVLGVVEGLGSVGVLKSPSTNRRSMVFSYILKFKEVMIHITTNTDSLDQKN